MGTENPRIVDHQLVRKCLSGDPVAERALHDAHVDRICRLGQTGDSRAVDVYAELLGLR